MLRAADVLLVPLVPSPLSLRTYDALRADLPKGLQVLPFFSMVDRRRTLHLTTVASIAGAVAVPAASAVEQMAVHRAPVVEFAASSPAAAAYVELWEATRALLR